MSTDRKKRIEREREEKRSENSICSNYSYVKALRSCSAQKGGTNKLWPKSGKQQNTQKQDQ